MAERKKMIISLSNRTQATVWDKDDVIRLRKTHRIVGSLLGSLPRKPWQNQVMALPLELSKEEVTLLVKKDLAIVIREDDIPNVPAQEIVAEFNRLREKSHFDQIEIFVKEREAKRKRYDRRELAGDGEALQKSPKQTKLNHEECKKLADNSLNVVKDVTDGEMINNAITDIGNDFAESKSHSNQCRMLEIDDKDSSIVNETDLKYYSKATWVHLPTSTGQPSNYIPENLSVQTTDWSFPSSEKDILKYEVFCDLWEKGYFITTGEKFGCDYLVYPGEPSRFHSRFIVLVMPSSKMLSNMELLAYARLGTGVKKNVVIATKNLSRGVSIVYKSLSSFNIS
eukprot:gene7807-8654_t